MRNEYQEQAQRFMEETQTKFKAKYHDHGYHFADDKETRDIYKITLKTPKGSYTFKFGQSIANTGTEPTPYDIFACLTKGDPGTFENFCSYFGYDQDSRKAEKTYKAVCKEWENISRIYTEEQIEKMQEIA